MKRQLPERVRLMLSAIRLGLDRYDEHDSRGLRKSITETEVDWAEAAFDARLWSAQLDAVARLLDQQAQDERRRETPMETAMTPAEKQVVLAYVVVNENVCKRRGCYRTATMQAINPNTTALLFACSKHATEEHEHVEHAKVLQEVLRMMGEPS